MSLNLKILIIEDEPGVQKVLESLIKSAFPNLILVAKCSSVKDAVHQINALEPDILLVDVEITGGTGFDVLSEIELQHKSIIFITAHANYAIKAIKVSAIDYLLKPIDSQEFKTAILKAIEEQIAARLSANQSVPEQKGKRLTLRDQQHVYFVKPENIVRCEAEGKYTSFFLLDQAKPIVVSNNLKEYEDSLSAHDFVRCHHSHLINRQFLVKMDKQNMLLYLSNGDMVPVSSRKRKDIFE